MKKCLLIVIAITFLMTGTGYGSEKIIDSQETEIRQETFWERYETLREVVGGLAVFLVLIYVSAECWSKRSSMGFSTSFNFW